MLTAEQINSIHRLHWSEHWSVRKIARHLHLGRRTISQYLVTPARSAARRQRASKLDPFKATIAELLEQDAKASAMVIAQRLRPLGFTGGLSILKDYLHAVRAHTAAKRAYVRMETGPGERFEIDMDRGYIDFQRLFVFTLSSAFFVVRTKSNLLIQRRYSHPVDKNTGVCADQTVILTSFESASAYPDALRRVSYFDAETNKRLKFLTNNFVLPALTIAQIYKCRWQVELFFKWIKQHLRIKASLTSRPVNGKTHC